MERITKSSQSVSAWVLKTQATMERLGFSEITLDVRRERISGKQEGQLLCVAIESLASGTTQVRFSSDSPQLVSRFAFEVQIEFARGEDKETVSGKEKGQRTREQGRPQPQSPKPIAPRSSVLRMKTTTARSLVVCFGFALIVVCLCLLFSGCVLNWMIL